MRFNKFSYVLVGFVAGLIVASVFAVKEVRAQWGDSFTEDKLKPPVPAKYGNLVAASGQDMYFQASDGTVYVVRQRAAGRLDNRVTVIVRATEE